MCNLDSRVISRDRVNVIEINLDSRAIYRADGNVRKYYLDMSQVGFNPPFSNDLRDTAVYKRLQMFTNDYKHL